MTASERSFIGLAKQSGKGTPNTTDADFAYLLFRAGGVSANSLVLPIEAEVGGGAVGRGMEKVGVQSGGALDFLPRPATLGRLLYGVYGSKTVANEAGDSPRNAADKILPLTELTLNAMEDYDIGIQSPPTPMVLTIKGLEGGASALTGNVVIYGTDADDDPLTDTIALDGDEYVDGIEIFKTVTKVDLPARVNVGDKVSIGWEDGAYKHTFVLPTDQFDAPYWTLRSAPGGLWGEQLQDCRVAGLALSFAGARFVEAAATFVGGLPAKVSTTAWGALAKVDRGPQFISPVGAIELPTGASAKVLSGSVAWGLNIPMDEQFIVGSYSPDDFDITQRSMAISLNVKVTSDELYTKMMYDPAGGADWAAGMFKEADILLRLRSAYEAAVGVPFEINLKASPGDDNITWQAAPIGLRAGRQVVMAITGIVTSIASGSPMTAELINDVAAY